MERETKKIKLPVTDYEVEIKTFITGRESREVQDVFLCNIKVDGTGNSDKIDASLTNKAQDKAIEIVIESINGEKEDLLNKVLDLPVRDYNFLMKAIDDVQSGMSAEKKTK